LAYKLQIQQKSNPAKSGFYTSDIRIRYPAENQYPSIPTHGIQGAPN